MHGDPKAKDLGAIADPCNASHSMRLNFMPGLELRPDSHSGSHAPQIGLAGLFLQFFEQGHFILLPQLNICTTQLGD